MVLLFLVTQTPTLWQTSSAHGEVHVDIRTLKCLSGERLQALT